MSSVPPGGDVEMWTAASRRDALKSFAAAVAAVSLPRELWAATGKPTFLSAAEIAFVGELAETIIPATDTPGAKGAGVPLAFDGMMTGWASTKTRAAFRATLAALAADLAARGGRPFVTAAPAHRFAALAALDVDAYGPRGTDYGDYRELKTLLVRLYYNSEVGASQELQYDAVPGEWLACVPLAEIGKAWAT